MRSFGFNSSQPLPQKYFGISGFGAKPPRRRATETFDWKIFTRHDLPHRCSTPPRRALRADPPPPGEGEDGALPLSGEGFMAPIAQRLVRGALAGAEPDFLVRGCFPFLRAEFASFVRAVAERLRLRAPAGAPPIALAGHDVDRDRPAAADFRHSAHRPFPPPSVASHASPHALASSRTRKM